MHKHNLAPADIGHTGESRVVAWLRANGFTVEVWDTRAPGATDIEARGILVQVKTAVTPNAPGQMTTSEVHRITARARRMGREAWLAQAVIDRAGQPVGKIAWTQLA